MPRASRHLQRPVVPRAWSAGSRSGGDARRRVRDVAPWVLAATVGAGAGPASATAPHPWYGPAKIVSVDGPARVTIESGRRTLRVRLVGVDTPDPGECGAEQSTAALRRIAAKRYTGLQFVLRTLPGGGYATDPEGYPYAELAPSNRHGTLNGPSLGRRLIRSGWAREGVPLGADGTAQSLASSSSTVGTGDEIDQPGKRGVWTSCAGLMHQPGAETVPTTAPSMWSIDKDGITRAAGPVLLPAGAGITAGAIAAIAGVGPLEFVDASGSCTGYVPVVQLKIEMASGYGEARPCADASVYLVSSYGPGKPRADRGLRAGDSFGAVKALFPSVEAKVVENPVSLTGWPKYRQPWQSYATLDGRGKVESFVAISAAGLIGDDGD